MSCFDDIFGKKTSLDRVTFEGNEVEAMRPVKGKDSRDEGAKENRPNEVTHYRLTVKKPDGDLDFRHFRIEEIPYLVETERLVIDRGFYSLARQQDREIYGRDPLIRATREQQDRVDLKLFCVGLVRKARKNGMKLTREGVAEMRPKMSEEFELYQAYKYYATDRVNSTQRFKPLPKPSTLLDDFRRFRNSEDNPCVFLRGYSSTTTDKKRRDENFAFVIQRLEKFASSEIRYKSDVIGDLRRALQEENRARDAAGRTDLIEERSDRTYQRWIDQHLDPFVVEVQRTGRATALKTYGTIENGLTASFPGELVQVDAWMFHIETLVTTRERWNQMTPNQRKRVKRVRRWVTVIIDIATRCILGFSISKHPNENASLEALRMCFEDKTYLLRAVGIEEGHYNYRCAIQQMANDNGSEFGRTPFGGVLFAQGVRSLGSSLMNTAAGASWLRGHVERFFNTCDMQFARRLPGYTGNNPHTRNDRKPSEEACITDDELHTLFLMFIARYHNSPHRGLEGRTPAAVWDELIKHEDYDDKQIPGPEKLREACGFETEARITRNGISFAGLRYSNNFTRTQLLARPGERVSGQGDKVRIKVDPFNMGAISVITNDDLVPVPCLTPNMTGKTYRQWQEAKANAKAFVKSENLTREAARSEAISLAEQLVGGILRTTDIGIMGYTNDEIDRAKLELSFGKGQHEKPFVGKDEYGDPVYGGSDTQHGGIPDEHHDHEDSPSPMDRLRSDASKRRKRMGSDR